MSTSSKNCDAKEVKEYRIRTALEQSRLRALGSVQSFVCLPRYSCTSTPPPPLLEEEKNCLISNPVD